jgi:hypothetical protein
MPKSKVWPDPLPTGTPVLVTGHRLGKIVGFVSTIEKWEKTWAYRLNADPAEPDTRTYPARYVRPLDLTDPEDLEVWLDE